MRAFLVFFVGVLATTDAAACAPTPPATALVNSTTVGGTVGSSTLSTMSAIADVVPVFPPNRGPAVSALRLRISNKSNTCAVLHDAAANTLDVRLVFPGTLSLGTFPVEDPAGGVPADDKAIVVVESSDASCAAITSRVATTGSLTIKTARLTGPVTNVAGSVDVTFEGGHIAGDFNAAFCPTDVAAAVAAGPDAGSGVCTP